MKPSTATQWVSSRRQRGAGLVEIMIGIVIGLITLLSVYSMYTVNEKEKRTTTGSSDAQQTGAFALYILSHDLAKAGNTIASSAPQLGGLPAATACSALPTVRPIPIIITDGGNANTPDSIAVFYGGSGTQPLAAGLLNTAAATDPYWVNGPVGYNIGDVLLAVQVVAGLGQCSVSTVTKISSTTAYSNDGPLPASGNVYLSHTNPGDANTFAPGNNAWIINLGTQTSGGRIVYTVDNSTGLLPCDNTTGKVCVLNSVNQLVTGAAKAPLASNVVNLKAQYGLDTDGDGIVDKWLPATAGSNWDHTNILSMSAASGASPGLKQIRAVRISIVTRSDQYEKDIVTPGPLLMLGGAAAAPFAGYDMTIAAGDPQHYHYQVFESVIPLRNAIWNDK
jgi:type IV pilus assembly protein PilW